MSMLRTHKQAEDFSLSESIATVSEKWERQVVAYFEVQWKKKVFKVHQFQGTIGKGTPLNVRNEVRLASRVLHFSRPT